MASKADAAEQLRAVLPDADFERLVERQLEVAEAAVKGEPVLVPMLAVIEPGTEHRLKLTTLVIALGEDRHEMMAQLGGQLARQGGQPLGVILVTEAWARSFSPEQAKARSRPVSAYEDKEEVVIAAGLTIDRRAYTLSSPIERDAQGRISGLAAPRRPLHQSRIYLLERFYEGYLAAVAAHAGQEGGAPG